MIFPVSGHITCLREKFRSSQTNAHDLICSVNVLKLLGSSGKSLIVHYYSENGMNLRPLDLLKENDLVKMPWLYLYFVTNGMHGFDVDMEAVAAGRGAAGLVKAAKK